MPQRHPLLSVGALSAAFALAASACGGGDDRPAPAAGGSVGTGATGGGGSGGTGGNVGGASGAGADAGVGGASGADGGGTGGATGGTGGGGAPGVCGNTIREGNEECDGGDLGGLQCFQLGFEGGALKCAPTGCKFDKSGCFGTENCYDGKDNDGDGNADCADSDCAASCAASSCNTPVPLADPSTINGDTTGHASTLESSCATGSGGPEILYEVTAKNAGVFEVALTPKAALTLSVRTTCLSAASELACVIGGRVKVPSTAGQKFFVLVDGNDAATAGSFTISAESRAIACGDAHRDGTEECDDGGKTPGDGCSATCKLESDETEPDATSAQASTYVVDYAAAIMPAGDVDVVKFTMPAGKTSMTVDTFDFGDGACSKGELDSFLEILGTDGSSVLASDDDGGQGACAKATATGLSPGSVYFIRVTASSFGGVTTFPYRLAIQTN